MSNPADTQLPPKSGIHFSLVMVGIPLWFVGVAIGRLGHPALGVAIRWIAIACLVPWAVRRSSLTVWTLLAMAAGAELGVDAPRVARQLYFLGDMFLRLIRMLVAPLLFASITTGIAAHSHLRSVGRVAVKALIYFEVVTTLGLILGMLAIHISGAGWGIALPAMQTVVTQAPAVRGAGTWQQIILNFVPENIVQAVGQNQILQVVIFSLLFGSALALLSKQKRAPLFAVLQSLTDAMFQLTRIVMYLAPIAAGAALAYTVGSVGLGSLLSLVGLSSPTTLRWRFCTSWFRFRYCSHFTYQSGNLSRRLASRPPLGSPPQLQTALPLAMERMEEFGVPRWIASFVIPLGYSFNMDGSSVYLSMAAIFAAQAAGIHLSLGQQIAMLATLMVASKGMAGVPRTVLVILLATASSIDIPTTPILLLLGVDTLMDMGRTAVNVVGNCMASAVIARTENAFPAGGAAIDRYAPRPPGPGKPAIERGVIRQFFALKPVSHSALRVRL